jgi:hypothetical protein
MKALDDVATALANSHDVTGYLMQLVIVDELQLPPVDDVSEGSH